MTAFPHNLWHHFQLKEYINNDAVLAIDPRRERTVFIRRTASPRPEDVSPWQAYARQRQSLAHPNIVALHDVFQIDGSLYWIFDYCNAGTLATLLNTGTNATLPLPEALDIGLSLSSALVAADKVGIHGAILSPDALYLHRTEAGLVVKISTFESDGQEGVSLEETSSEAPTHSPLEMPAVRHINSPVDVYRLGKLLVTLLAGDDVLPEYSNLPDWFNALLRMMIAENPEQRPDITEVHHALRHRTRLRKQPSPSVSSSPPATTSIDKRMVWLGVGFTAVLLPALLSLGLVWGYLHLTTPLSTAQPIADASPSVDVMPAPLPQDSTASPYEQAVVQNANQYDGLKLRAEPNREAQLIATLFDGDVVEITAYNEDKNWAHIITGENRLQGWVYVGHYLNLEP